jgi:hypothetical protein
VQIVPIISSKKRTTRVLPYAFDAIAHILTRDLRLDPATLAAMVRTRFATQLVPAAIQPQIDVAAHYGLFAAFPASDLLLTSAR